MIKQNNIQENAKRIKHTYNVDDKILIATDPQDPKYDKKYLGTYPVVQVNDNGAIKYRKGAALDIVNIRNVHPYKE